MLKEDKFLSHCRTRLDCAFEWLRVAVRCIVYESEWSNQRTDQYSPDSTISVLWHGHNRNTVLVEALRDVEDGKGHGAGDPYRDVSELKTWADATSKTEAYCAGIFLWVFAKKTFR